jgi:hypothetical protein
LESWNFEFLQFIVTILRNLSHYEVASLRVAGPRCFHSYCLTNVAQGI